MFCERDENCWSLMWQCFTFFERRRIRCVRAVATCFKFYVHCTWVPLMIESMTNVKSIFFIQYICLQFDFNKSYIQYCVNDWAKHCVSKVILHNFICVNRIWTKVLAVFIIYCFIGYIIDVIWNIISFKWLDYLLHFHLKTKLSPAPTKKYPHCGFS